MGFKIGNRTFPEGVAENLCNLRKNLPNLREMNQDLNKSEKRFFCSK